MYKRQALRLVNSSLLLKSRDESLATLDIVKIDLYTGKAVFYLSLIHICPLGAFYALMNKVSLFGIKVDEHKCVSCGKCAGACKMDVDITKTPEDVYKRQI